MCVWAKFEQRKWVKLETHHVCFKYFCRDNLPEIYVEDDAGCFWIPTTDFPKFGDREPTS